MYQLHPHGWSDIFWMERVVDSRALLDREYFYWTIQFFTISQMECRKSPALGTDLFVAL
jgi:hypothetical protein